MRNFLNPQKIIGLITGLLVFLLAIFAFVLSYDALWTLALNSGVNRYVAWMWPLTLDFVVIVAAMAILTFSLNGEGKGYAWVLTIVFAALSVVFNALHTDINLVWYDQIVKPYLPIVVFVLPPIALALGFHLFVIQIERSIRRRGLVQSLDFLTKAVDKKSKQLSRVDKKDEKESGDMSIKKRRQVVKQQHGEIPVNDLAERLGVSPKTIYRDIKIVTNGKGGQ